jgi:hypothetical protein
MDFNAMRLSLLAGIGDPNDRHDIVKEQVKQLNESSEARQLNEDEEEVRKAVRRTIQKMISEGTISLQEDSISRELEHLRANIKADHDHLEALVNDMHHDKDEIERAEHHREEIHEDEDRVAQSADLEDDPAYGGEVGKTYDEITEDEDKKDDSKKPGTGSSPRPDDGPSDADLKLVQKLYKKLGPVDLEDILKKHNMKPMEESEQVEETLSEADATLTRLQMLAGVRILSEARDEDVEEANHSEDEDHMEEVVVDGASPDDLNAPPPTDWTPEGEDHGRRQNVHGNGRQEVHDARDGRRVKRARRRRRSLRRQRSRRQRRSQR